MMSSKNPNPKTPAQGFEKDIQMGFKEDFIDPGDDYLKRLQTPEAEKNPGEFKVDQYLGDFKSNTKRVRVVFRDHQHPEAMATAFKFASTIKFSTRTFSYSKAIKNSISILTLVLTKSILSL